MKALQMSLVAAEMSDINNPVGPPRATTKIIVIDENFF
jgi:hypothetical protein